MKEVPDAGLNYFIMQRELRSIISYIWTTDMDWYWEEETALGEIENNIFLNSGLLRQDEKGRFFCGKEDVIRWMVDHMIHS